jgi:isoleucyl-tRNA synthetase
MSDAPPINYQTTLNLPTTDFPMKAQLSAREPDIIKFWQDLNIYQKIRERDPGRKKFILHDGPPYANGQIHIGHAVNKTLKDIILKAKTLSGYACPYVPGWDCHGLPIELNVEKKIGKPGKDISTTAFQQACRMYAQEQVNLQRDEFKRLGVFADWDHPYRTMDFTFEANIIRTLSTIIANGHVQQGKKPVHWCVECGSSLAEAEVEYADKQSPALDVHFMVADVANLLHRFGLTHIDLNDTTIQTSIPIWTTTPWTLPANEAVTLHPDYLYALVQHHSANGIERIVLADDLIASCAQRYQWEQYEVLGHCEGKALAGVQVHHPFYDKQVPVILGDHVTLDTGTGAVHTAPAHGLEDYIVATAYQLPVNNMVAGNGCFLPETPLFAGLFVLKANDVIIELLKDKHALLHATTLTHSYPHCWRHKKPLIFMATPQWFMSMTAKNLREQALAAIATVAWIPDWGQARIEAMINQRPDWCISRQRTWGTPMGLFVHQHTQSLHPKTTELLEVVATAIGEHGLEIWFLLEHEELAQHPEYQQAVATLKANLLAVAGEQLFNDYRKLNDTLDVWFDSGSSNFCVLRTNPALEFPADLYLEGSDQHRGWFQTSLLASVAHSGQAPYRQVLTHGFTVDEKGRKMSKSLGNTVLPEKVIKTLGADILRLWVSATDYRGEIAVSDQILERTADTYRRMRNTARFLLANLNDFDPTHQLITVADMVALDRYIVKQAAQLQEEIINAYDNYQFHVVYQKIHSFCTNDLGSFYLDVIKDRQYTTPKESIARRSAQSAMFHVAHALCRWLAPILSFTAEEIWQYMPGKHEESIFLTTWYDLQFLTKDLYDDGIQWQEIIQIRNAVNKEIEGQRANSKLGSALEADITLYADDAKFAQLTQLKDELRFILITSSATVLPLMQAHAQTSTTELPGLALDVIATPHTKCARCWHRRADVGTRAEHPQLCGRCVQNISGEPEMRLYA